MTTAPKYSALWEVWAALDELICGLTFPSDATIEGPQPHFGWPGRQDSIEAVTLVGALATPTDDNWWTMGPGSKDETFAFLVVVETAIPGRDARQVRSRLADLVMPIDDAFRQVQGRSRRPEVTGGQWWQVVSRRPLIFETDQGAHGECELVITARVVR